MGGCHEGCAKDCDYHGDLVCMGTGDEPPVCTGAPPNKAGSKCTVGAPVCLPVRVSLCNHDLPIRRQMNRRRKAARLILSWSSLLPLLPLDEEDFQASGLKPEHH